MLSGFNVHPTLPASDIERAKKFYGETLGFEKVSDNPAGIFFKSGSTEFLVFPSPKAGSNPNTYAGWRVDDLEKVVADLQAKGVKFEDYETPKTENGIATTPAGKAAWFKDSEGNTLGVVQLT